jgi:hypothetical protein
MLLSLGRRVCASTRQAMLGLGRVCQQTPLGSQRLGLMVQLVGLLNFGQAMFVKHKSTQTTGAMSVGSTTSIPLLLGTNNSERLRIDSSGNVGIGVVPEAWSALYGTKALQVGAQASLSDINGDLHLSSNAYYDTTDARWEYINADYATKYTQVDGVHQWLTAGIGTADAAITWSESMRIGSDGKVDIGGIPNQTIAVLNARFNGAALEFGHGNNSAGYYGTAGSYGNNGQPYIGFSCYAQENLNLFTTNGHKGNIITGDLSGSLTFAQITNATAVDQTPVNRMTLDASGNLLVGKTNTSNLLTTAGHVFYGNGEAFLTRAGTPLFLGRTGSDGSLANFYKDGAPVGSIGTSGDDLTVGNDVTTLKFHNTLNTIHPNGTGSGSDGLTTLGWTNNRFKDLYLSGNIALTTADNASASNIFVSPSTDYLYLEHPSNGMIFRNTAGAEAMRINSSGNLAFPTGKGIDFSAVTGGTGTATSNVLDDYEEGTFTPSWNGSVTAGTASGTFDGTYTKIGRVVYCTINLSACNLTGASGALQITGLPFSAASGNVKSGGTAYLEGITPSFSNTPQTGSHVQLYVSFGTTTAQFRVGLSAQWDNYLSAGSTFTSGGGSTYGIVSITYIT